MKGSSAIMDCISLKCVEPFHVTNIARAEISTVGQGTVKRFMHFEGNPLAGPMIIQQAMS